MKLCVEHLGFTFLAHPVFLETRMFRLSDGEEIMTLAFFVLIQYRSVTDGRTDGQTDGHIPPLAISAVCIARYANALVIMPVYWYFHWNFPENIALF